MAEQTKVPAKTGNGQVATRDPFALLSALQDEMEHLWAQWPFGRRAPFARAPRPSAVWVPRLDVYEQNGALIVKAELPGVKKEDLEVSLDGEDLIIAGERKAETEVKEESYYRLERNYGRFYRQIALPSAVDAGKIDATFADGVLEVKIPKPAETPPQAKQIAVK